MKDITVGDVIKALKGMMKKPQKVPAKSKQKPRKYTPYGGPR